MQYINRNIHIQSFFGIYRIVKNMKETIWKVIVHWLAEKKKKHTHALMYLY